LRLKYEKVNFGAIDCICRKGNHIFHMSINVFFCIPFVIGKHPVHISFGVAVIFFIQMIGCLYLEYILENPSKNLIAIFYLASARIRDGKVRLKKKMKKVFFFFRKKS
jgi:hypothetical protein